MRQDLTGSPQARARAAYLAIALSNAETLIKERPDDWEQAIAALKAQAKMVKALFKAPPETAKPLQDRARAAGVELPSTTKSRPSK